MTLFQPFHSADVREAVGHQIRGYRMARQQAAADQRQFLAAQAAELHDMVAKALADMDSDLSASAEAQRNHLQTIVDTLRKDVADLLHGLSTDRRARTADLQQQRAQELRDLRQHVANYLGDLSAERADMAAAQWDRLSLDRQSRAHDVANMLAELHITRPVALPPTLPAMPATDTPTSSVPVAEPPTSDEDDLDMVQRFGQAGLVAYAQMARVTILRVLEGGAPSDDQEIQIGAQVDGLSGNVQPFLAELMRTFGRFSPAERDQMGEIVLGVQRNVVALSRELETSPWPTSPAQHEDFRRMIEDLRHRLAPLLNELDVAAQALQAPAEPVSEPEPTQARSYRDNLTTIHGIGPALQQRLDRAGICTYIQLALSSPEDLRKALGDAGRLANVEDWIVQARSLAGMPS